MKSFHITLSTLGVLSLSVLSAPIPVNGIDPDVGDLVTDILVLVGGAIGIFTPIQLLGGVLLSMVD